MPDIVSMALFARRDRVLLARRKDGHAPFGGSWALPAVLVGSDEPAEEALERHTYHELNVEIAAPQFAETLYLEDAGRRFVANVFRVPSYKGDLRFRTAGDYDDVRWLTRDELASLPMPHALSAWLRGGRYVGVTAAPSRLPPGESAPNNRTGWNAISRAYQDRYQLPADRIVYGGAVPDEDELSLLGDVSGQRVVVLGCGGGQDCIALARRGAQVVGFDLSDKQIEYGRRLAEREGVLVTLLQGNVEELRGVDDETQDLAVSLHALNYVERVDRAFAEAYRVLRPGSAFVFSVHHPFDVCLEDTPPFGAAKSYWEPVVDWQWDFPEARVSGRLRSWYRTMAGWFALLTDAGFRVERLLEPSPTAADVTEPWRSLGYTPQKAELIPETLIIKARKP